MSSLLIFSLLLLSLATIANTRSVRESPVTLCPDEDEPVCGMDGRPYRNRCVLEQQSNGIDMAYTGACRPRAPCPIAILCVSYLHLVCGTDGVTYRNSCVMFDRNCDNVITAYDGEC